MLTKDIRSSARINVKGLFTVLRDIVKFMFAGDFFAPPAEAIDDLKLLVSGDSALVW